MTGRRGRRTALLAAVAAVVVTVPAATAHAAPVQRRPARTAPALITGRRLDLRAVTAVAPGDLWAATASRTGDHHHAVTLHGLGGHWVRRSGAVLPDYPELLGIDGSGAADVWAVGDSEHGAVAEHWNGRGWKRYPVPTPGFDSVLNAVTVLGPDDVWAVGSYLHDRGSLSQTLILHWNGRTWTRSPSPTTSPYVDLAAVAFPSTHLGFAVGETSHGSLLLRWNGTRWVEVDIPVGGGAEFFAATAISAHDVWIAGDIGSRSLTYHWNGRAWTHVRSPSYGDEFTYVSGLSGTGPNDVWAVGATSPPGRRPIHPLTLHWNGSRWTRVACPNPGRRAGGLEGVAAIGPDNAWAVGSYPLTPQRAVLLHWDGTSWQVA